MKKIPLFYPYVNDAARKNVQKVLSGKTLSQGPVVEQFEKKFAKTFGFEQWQVVSLNSGTAALELAYELCNINPGDEVITPVLTCTATNIPLARRHAHIVFGDVEGKTHLNMDADDVESKISEKTKAIVFVHFGGSSEGLAEIQKLAHAHKINLICDAAQALGAPLSTLARFNCISLQAIKSLTAGDGGVLICKNKKDAEKARKLRWFGYDRALKQKLGDTDLELAGYKMHMNDINAAIALGNLQDWKAIAMHRKYINAIYADTAERRGFSVVQGIWNPQVIGVDFTTTKERLAKKGIEIGQYHYRNDRYSIFKKAESECIQMNKIENNYFILPCHLHMTLHDAERIADLLWPTK